MYFLLCQTARGQSVEDYCGLINLSHRMNLYTAVSGVANRVINADVLLEFLRGTECQHRAHSLTVCPRLYATIEPTNNPLHLLACLTTLHRL